MSGLFDEIIAEGKVMTAPQHKDGHCFCLDASAELVYI